MVERAARASGSLPADYARIPVEVRAQILADVARAHELEGGATRRVVARVSALVGLDFGLSWRDRTSVADALIRAGSPTLTLWALALLAAVFLGLGTAVLAVRGLGGKLDLVLSALAGVAFAVPPVWLGLLALSTFADGRPFRIVPIEGLGSPAAYVLPVVCLALVPGFVIARHARAALVEAARTPWAVAARARGGSRDRVLMVHCLRACAGQLIALTPVLVAYLTGATVVIEEVFGIPGLGALLLGAAEYGDAPVVVGAAVVSATVIAGASVLAELLARLADPREAR